MARRPNPRAAWLLAAAALVTATFGWSCSESKTYVARSSRGSQRLTAVSSFGTNPGKLNMYEYVPADVPANAPLVVALHGCLQTALDYTKAGWNELADKYKFYLLYPEQTKANNPALCFNWAGYYGDPADMKRGLGENQSIKEMVDQMKADHSIDASRVFITGMSAGGGFAAVMMATWPEVFAAGAPVAGIPYECTEKFAEAFTCTNPGMTKSAKEWGDLVRDAFAGYTGPYPRVSVWQGTKDTIVGTANLTEMVKQWTNVHGVSETPTLTDDVGGNRHDVHAKADGTVVVESYRIEGMGHGVAVDPTNDCGVAGAYVLDAKICSSFYIAKFFGLTGGSVGPVRDAGAGGAGNADAGNADAGNDDAVDPVDPPPPDAPPPPACNEFNDSNYGHVVAGRATRCGVGGSYVCARGSGENMGLYTLIPNWLREVRPGYFEMGRCP